MAPKAARKRCILYILGGFSMGDRFEFGSVDQQVRKPWDKPG